MRWACVHDRKNFFINREEGLASTHWPCDIIKNGGAPRLSSVTPLPNVAGLVAVFLRPLTNVITLASLFYSGSVGVSKLVNMGGDQVVKGPSTLHNVLEIMNSKRKLVSKG